MARALVLVAALGAAGAEVAPAATVTFEVGNGGAPRFARDRPDLTTVSPNADGFRDAALLRFGLPFDAVVRLDVLQRGRPALRLGGPMRRRAGSHVRRRVPPAYPVPAAYIVRLTVTRPGTRAVVRTAIVHVQGVDAAAGQASYRPGDTVRVGVATDARVPSVDVLHVDDVAPTTRRNDVVEGTAVMRPAVSAGPRAGTACTPWRCRSARGRVACTWSG